MFGNHLNYLAVLVSGVIMFVMGALWYSPMLFARPWMALLGKSEEELKSSAKPINYLFAFLCALASAYVLAVLLALIPGATVATGLCLGALCWFGFAGATSLMHAIFSARPFGLWAIDTGYSLATFLVAGVILALWR